MITIEPMDGGILKITPPEKLSANDFNSLTPQIEEAINAYGKIRLLVDATHFSGWENMEAFERHMKFIKQHQQSVERGAILIGHEWQRWFAGIIHFFVHPDIRTFDQDEETKAKQWLESGIKK